MARVLSVNGIDFIAAGAVQERSVRWGPLDIGQHVSTLSFETVPGAALNVCPNASFEIGGAATADGWVIYDNGVEATSGIVPGRSGSRAWRTTWAGASTNTKGVFRSGGTPAMAGWQPLRTYTVSFWARTRLTPSIAGGMTLGWNTPPAQTDTLFNPNLTTLWQQYAFRITWGSAVDTIGGGAALYMSIAQYVGMAANSVDIDDVIVALGGEVPPAGLPFVPSDGDYVFWTDADGITKRFSGHARQPEAHLPTGLPLYYTVNCSDWGAVIDTVKITADHVFSAGSNDRFIVETLLTAYYGSVATTGLAHRITAANVSMPAYTILKGVSLLTALNALAAALGGVPWWIDADKNVHWNDVRTVAPFAITDDAAASTVLYRDEVLLDAPVLYMRLSDTTGTVAIDSVANTHPGTYVGTPTLGQACLVDDGSFSVSFDGVDDRVDIGDFFDFAGVAPFTIELWFVPDVVDATSRRLVSKENGSQAYIVYYYNGGIRFQRNDGAGNQADVGTSVAPSVGVKYHVVATFDGTTHALYANAVLGTTSATVVSLPNHAGSLTIGSVTGGGSRTDGLIDEVAIYEYALLPYRIAAHYAAATPIKAYADLRDLTDSSKICFRVRVVGSGATEATVTDWTGISRYAAKIASEPGAPGVRYHDLPDVSDPTLATVGECEQRGWSELDKADATRHIAVTMLNDGLYPGVLVDVIASQIGATTIGGSPVRPYPRASDRNTIRAVGVQNLRASLGRFMVQRVSPTPRVGDETYRFVVELADYESDLSTTLARI